MGKSILFCEERLKLGEHFVTHKVVKVFEAFGGRLFLGWSPFIKCYLEGDFQVGHWIKIIGFPSESYDFLAIIEDANRMNGVAGEPSLQAECSISQPHTSGFRGNLCAYLACHSEDRTSVFVIVPEAIENPERVQVWVIPSLVRLVGLETFDEVYGSLREALERFLSLSERLATLADRKGQVLQYLRGALGKDTELPHGIVQNGTEVMDTVSSEESQSGWKFFPTLRLNPQELIDSISVFLSHHFVRVTINEPSDLTVEVIHVHLRPFKAPMQLFQVGGHE